MFVIFSTKSCALFQKPSQSPNTLYFLHFRLSDNIPFRFANNLLNFLASAFPQIQLRVTFKSTERLSSLFRLKDQIPFALRSRVVYKFKCQWCQSLYVSETFRHSHTRASEHLGVSAYTGKPLSYTSNSSVLTHHEQTGHSISIDDFSILSTSSSNFELLLREWWWWWW